MIFRVVLVALDFRGICEAPWEKGPDVAQTRSEIFDFIEKYRIFLQNFCCREKASLICYKQSHKFF